MYRKYIVNNDTMNVYYMKLYEYKVNKFIDECDIDSIKCKPILVNDHVELAEYNIDHRYFYEHINNIEIYDQLDEYNELINNNESIDIINNKIESICKKYNKMLVSSIKNLLIHVRNAFNNALYYIDHSITDIETLNHPIYLMSELHMMNDDLFTIIETEHENDFNKITDFLINLCNDYSKKIENKTNILYVTTFDICNNILKLILDIKTNDIINIIDEEEYENRK